MFDFVQIIKDAIDGLGRFILNGVIEPGLKAMLESVTSSAHIADFEFFLPMYMAVRVIAIALLTGITAWNLLKSYFSFTGIDADDPLQFGLQYFATLFVIWYSKEILLFAVSLNESFIAVITDAAYSATFSDAQGSLMLVPVLTGIFAFFTTGGLAVSLFSWLIIPVVYLLYKLIRLLIRMFFRLVLLTFLIICAPLALAAGVSKATRSMQVGFIRTFVGSLVVQLVQTICLMAIEIYAVHDLSTIASLMSLAGIIHVLDRVEELVREMTLGIGFGGHEGGMLQSYGSLQVVQTMYRVAAAHFPPLAAAAPVAAAASKAKS